MTKIFLSWLAGMIDADGCIFVGIRKQQTTHPYIGITPVVNVTQHIKYKWVCDKIQKTLGFGKVYVANRYKGASAKATWQTTRMQETIKILDLVLPYLVVKRSKAKLVLPELKKWIKTSSLVAENAILREQGLTIRKQKNVLSMVKMATKLNSDMRTSTRYRNYHTFDYWEPLIKQWYPK